MEDRIHKILKTISNAPDPQIDLPTPHDYELDALSLIHQSIDSLDAQLKESEEHQRKYETKTLILGVLNLILVLLTLAVSLISCQQQTNHSEPLAVLEVLLLHLSNML